MSAAIVNIQYYCEPKALENMNGKSSKERSNRVRIIGGTHRSRHLSFPSASVLRPTSDRIRESLFNWLQNDLPYSKCLDLFSGSGALGIEALSRGAKWVQFVEQNSQVAKAIQHNLTLLEIDSANVAVQSTERWLLSKSGGDKFDIVFIDPPYSLNLIGKTCEQLLNSDLLVPGAKIYIENGSPLKTDELPIAFQQLKEKKAGQVHYYLYSYNADLK